jgi:hypothetical protein
MHFLSSTFIGEYRKFYRSNSHCALWTELLYTVLWQFFSLDKFHNKNKILELWQCFMYISTTSTTSQEILWPENYIHHYLPIRYYVGQFILASCHLFSAVPKLFFPLDYTVMCSCTPTPTHYSYMLFSVSLVHFCEFDDLFCF